MRNAWDVFSPFNPSWLSDAATETMQRVLRGLPRFNAQERMLRSWYLPLWCLVNAATAVVRLLRITVSGLLASAERLHREDVAG